jgi:hypothetical protein
VITAGGGGAIEDLEELKAALAGARGAIELTGVRTTGGRRSAATFTLPIPDR